MQICVLNLLLRQGTLWETTPRTFNEHDHNVMLSTDCVLAY